MTWWGKNRAGDALTVTKVWRKKWDFAESPKYLSHSGVECAQYSRRRSRGSGKEGVTTIIFCIPGMTWSWRPNEFFLSFFYSGSSRDLWPQPDHGQGPSTLRTFTLYALTILISLSRPALQLAFTSHKLPTQKTGKNFRTEFFLEAKSRAWRWNPDRLRPTRWYPDIS
jgi:hypothetical protein